MEFEIIRGVWSAPEAGEVLLAEYGERWVAEPDLAQSAPRRRHTVAAGRQGVPAAPGDLQHTAVKEDSLVRENPCRIKGYDQYHVPERPVATVEQAYALADAMPPRFYALVVVAAFTGLP